MQIQHRDTKFIIAAAPNRAAVVLDIEERMRCICSDLSVEDGRAIGQALLDAADEVERTATVRLRNRDVWEMVSANLAASEAVLNTVKVRDTTHEERAAVAQILDAQTAVHSLLGIGL